MAQAFNHKAVNLWTSRIIPLILFGIVGYVTYVVIVRVCVHYLLDPNPQILAARPGSAIAILILYAILLVLLFSTYSRLLYVVTFNTGYVPRSAQWIAQNSKNSMNKRVRRKTTTEKIERDGSSGSTGNESLASSSDTPTTLEPAPGVQDFYNKDIYVCQGDGRPIWCSTCMNWKPDRTHHCREIERCVRKMDHFCPWVGGVVSETSFKFFIQFVGWTAVFCIFNLVVVAYFLAERRRETNSIEPHWLITLCFAALFGLFTVGMTGSSLQFAILNTTTIENLSRKTIVWTLAIHMPAPPTTLPAFRTISFSPSPRASKATHDQQLSSDTMRTFAILHTKPGENPFDLGPYRNFKSVMGDHWYDWFLPFRYSPCCDHDRYPGQFAMGPVVDRMRKEAGIALPDEEYGNEEREQRRRRRRRRRHQHDDTTTVVDGKVEQDEVDLEMGLGNGRTNGILT